MSISDFKVVGGRAEHKGLTSSLSEKDYEGVKCVVWFNALKNNRIPVKWFKPTKNGTKFRFVIPQSQKELDEAVEQLKEHITKVNEKYGLGIEIVPKKEQLA